MNENEDDKNNICAEIQELMIPYLNHYAAKEEISRLVLHLAECKECREEMTENIKLHSKIKLAFNHIPPEIKSRAYDKINFAARKQSQSVTDQIVDDIMTAVNAPLLELSSKLIHSLINSPVKRTISYTLSQVNAIDIEN